MKREVTLKALPKDHENNMVSCCSDGHITICVHNWSVLSKVSFCSKVSRPLCPVETLQVLLFLCVRRQPFRTFLNSSRFVIWLRWSPVPLKGGLMLWPQSCHWLSASAHLTSLNVRCDRDKSEQGACKKHNCWEARWRAPHALDPLPTKWPTVYLRGQIGQTVSNYPSIEGKDFLLLPFFCPFPSSLRFSHAVRGAAVLVKCFSKRTGWTTVSSGPVYVVYVAGQSNNNMNMLSQRKKPNCSLHPRPLWHFIHQPNWVNLIDLGSIPQLTRIPLSQWQWLCLLAAGVVSLYIMSEESVLCKVWKSIVSKYITWFRRNVFPRGRLLYIFFWKCGQIWKYKKCQELPIIKCRSPILKD